MSVIQISDLHRQGIDLFDDPESYVLDLQENEDLLSKINGGSTPGCLVASIVIVSVVSGARIGWEIGKAAAQYMNQHYPNNR